MISTGVSWGKALRLRAGVSRRTRHPGSRRHPTDAHRLCARGLFVRLSAAAGYDREELENAV